MVTATRCARWAHQKGVWGRGEAVIPMPSACCPPKHKARLPVKAAHNAAIVMYVPYANAGRRKDAAPLMSCGPRPRPSRRPRPRHAPPP